MSILKIFNARNIGALLCTPFLLSGCKYSDEEKQRRSIFIDHFVQNSLANCDLQEEFGKSANYEKRLRTVFDSVETKSLAFFNERGLRVCFDERIQDIESKFWETRIDAVYYPDERIIAISDDNYAGNLLDEFYKESHHHLERLEKFRVGKSYNISTGFSSKDHYKWSEDMARYNDFFEKNDQLRKPPTIYYTPYLTFEV